MAFRSIDRRRFLSTGGRTGLFVCGACFCARAAGWADEADAPGADQPIDPKKLNFCGYTCPEDCKWTEATLKDDPELKRAAWEAWKLEERYGVSFDEEQAFCHGCKALDKPDGAVVGNCTVRACARERKLDCCVECEELETCTHDLWKRFPEFHGGVVSMRQKLLQQG